MADWFVRREGKVRGVPRNTNQDPANDKVAVISDGSLQSSLTERPTGFVVDEEPTDNPPEMVDTYGDGTLLEDNGASFTADSPVWFDGSGGIQDSEPAATSGDVIFQAGYALTSTLIMVDIDAVEVA
jgi:hypothetical protein